MMSLLLCFFIILVALSEIKKEDKYRVVVEEVKKAFGVLGGGGRVTTPNDPKLSLIERLENLRLLKPMNKNRSNTDDPGVDGRDPQVTRVREGMLFTQGGRITFEPGSAQLSDLAMQQLMTIAGLTRGYNNKIELPRPHRHARAARRHRVSGLVGIEFLPCQGRDGLPHLR